MFRPSLVLATSGSLGRMLYGLVDMLSSMKHGTPPGVLGPTESDAFEGPATTPVLLNQSCAFSMLPWTSRATRIRTAHEVPGRNPPQMFHLAPQHDRTSEPFAAGARHEHSTIALAEPAYRPDSSDPA